MPFDPSQPFEVVEEQTTGFDPSKPFEVVEETTVAVAEPEGEPDEFGIGQEVRGVGRAFKRGFEGIRQVGNVLSLNARATAQEAAQKKLELATLSGDVREIGRLQDFMGYNAEKIDERIGDVVAREKAIREIPQSPDMASLGTDFWGTLARNPVEVIATVSAESLPLAAPGMIAGAVLGGPGGMAGGVGFGSLTVEYANSMMDSARDMGLDTTDPAQVKSVFTDPERMAAFRAKALERGIPVALFDAFSGAIAGRAVGKVMKAGGGTGPVIRATATELGQQAVLGSSGEAAGQLVSEGEITSVPDIALEGMAELGTSGFEIASNLRESKEVQAKAKAKKESPKAKEKPAEPPETVPVNPADTVATAEVGGSVISYTTKSGKRGSISVPNGKSTADALRHIERLGGTEPKVLVTPGVSGTPAPAATAAANVTAVSNPPTAVEPEVVEEPVAPVEVAETITTQEETDAAFAANEPISPTETVATEGTGEIPAAEGVVAPPPITEPATTETTNEAEVTTPSEVPVEQGQPVEEKPTVQAEVRTPPGTGEGQEATVEPADTPEQIVKDTVKEPQTSTVEALVSVPSPEPAEAKKFEVEASEKEKQSMPPMAPKAQKKFLISELDKAIEAAPTAEFPEVGRGPGRTEESRAETPAKNLSIYRENVAKFGTVTIEIPGDGTFTILNTAPALKAFREKANKFPVSGSVSTTKPGKPKTPGAAPIVSVGKSDKESIVKAATPFLDKSDSRPVLEAMWSNGKVTVSTDGRAMLVVNKGIGGTEKAPVLLTPEGKKPVRVDPQGNRTPIEASDFPKWQQVIPTDTFQVATDVDTARLISIVNQAESGVTRTDESKGRRSVVLLRNRDGTIGVKSNMPNVFSYEHNIQEGAELIGAFDPNYLIASLEAMRRLGDEKVSVEFKDSKAALVIKGNQSSAIVMPIRAELATPFVTRDSVKPGFIPEAPKRKRSKKNSLSASSTTGMDPNDLEIDVANMVAEWTSGPNVIVVNDPDWIINGSGVEAEYDPETGTITLNAAYLRNASHAQQVLSEEALAHYGLEGVFGEDLGRVLDEFPIPDSELFDVARQYGLDISDPSQKRLAKAEWLGKRAQSEQAKGWLKRTLDAIRDWWNRMTGVRPPEQLARELLTKASAFLTSGEARTQYFVEPLQSLGDQIDNIEAAAAATNVKANIPPKMVAYKPIGRFERLLGKIRRPSEVIRRYDPTGRLLPLKGQIEVIEAWQAAAIREQAEDLRNQLFETSGKGIASRWPAWLMNPAWKRRAREFAKLALPLAAHLNVVGRNPDGTWKYQDFDMRAGVMTEDTFNAAGHSIGDHIILDNPLTHTPEELVIGPKITMSTGKVAYQLFRSVSETRQAELYEHYNGMYPDLIWFVDMWLDPDLAGMRQTYGPVDIPVFNRFALADEMKVNDPSFNPVDGYTPDVLVNRSLLGAVIGAIQGISRGTVSPGRKYKTGRTRESGNVRDLLSGFNVRAFQAMRETSRRQWAKSVLNAGVPIPPTGIPEGWVDMGSGLRQLLEAIRAVNRMGTTVPYPEVLKRLANDGSPEYKALVVEAHRLNNRSRMIPQPLLDGVLHQYAQQETQSGLVRLLEWTIRNAKGLLLVHPKTILGNILTNEFFGAETASRYAISGLLKWDGQDMRFARNLMAGLFMNRFAGLRLAASNVFGRPADSTYLRAVQTVLPPEVFAGNTGLSDIQASYGDSAFDALREGELANAALQAVQYGAIDLRAKQRMAYAWLKAAAVTAARAKGLTGDKLKSDVDTYMEAPPLDDMARAVGAANFELLNYGDSPAFIAAMSRSTLGSLIMPFPRFGYHFLSKQAERLSSVRNLIGSVPPAARADAFADLVIVGFYGLGMAGAALAFAGGDDDDAREFAGTKSIRYIDDEGKERVEPIDPALNTFNRMNLSYWARASGLGGEGEEDFWIRVRTYPVLAAAGIGAIAMDDLRQLGPVAAAKSYISGMSDLLGDFLSLGIAARLPGKAWASMMEETTGRPQSVPLDNYATGIPFMAWLGQQTASTLIPGQRQADEMILWLDPTQRRLRSSKTLDYTPGFWDGMRVGGTVGLLDRIARGAESDLPPSGLIDRSTGEIEEPRQVDPMTRLWSLGGINAKMVPREAYEKALKE